MFYEMKNSPLSNRKILINLAKLQSIQSVDNLFIRFFLRDDDYYDDQFDTKDQRDIIFEMIKRNIDAF